MPGCTECTSDTNCVTCGTQHYSLFTDASSNQICKLDCRAQTSNTFNLSDTQCQNCPTLCALCSSATQCESCTSGNRLETLASGDKLCFRTCSSSEVINPFTKDCDACSAKFNNCNLCTFGAEGTNPDYTVVCNQCEAGYGFIDSLESTCANCSAISTGCNLCSYDSGNTRICNGCSSTHDLDSSLNKCFLKCTATQSINKVTSQCVECSTLNAFTTACSWNTAGQNIVATSCSTGYTVING